MAHLTPRLLTLMHCSQRDLIPRARMGSLHQVCLAEVPRASLCLAAGELWVVVLRLNLGS